MDGKATMGDARPTNDLSATARCECGRVGNGLKPEGARRPDRRTQTTPISNNQVKTLLHGLRMNAARPTAQAAHHRTAPVNYPELEDVTHGEGAGINILKF